MSKVELISGAEIDSDLGVVNAARVSFAKWGRWAIDPDTGMEVVGKLEKRETGLLRYLAREDHWTPYAHPQMVRRRTMETTNFVRWLASTGPGFHREILDLTSEKAVFLERASLFGYVDNWNLVDRGVRDQVRRLFPLTTDAFCLPKEEPAAGSEDLSEHGSLAPRNQVEAEMFASRHGSAGLAAMAMMSIRIETSLAMAAQLKRHCIGLVVNEVSRRYVDDAPEFFRPDSWRSRPDKSIKQGSGDEIVRTIQQRNRHGFAWPVSISAAFEEHLQSSARLYAEMVEGNVAPEMARLVLPVATNTLWIWTGSLADYARVCHLRLDGHAQKEVRDVADGIDAAAKEAYPDLWKTVLAAHRTRKNAGKDRILRAAA